MLASSMSPGSMSPGSMSLGRRSCELDVKRCGGSPSGARRQPSRCRRAPPGFGARGPLPPVRWRRPVSIPAGSSTARPSTARRRTARRRTAGRSTTGDRRAFFQGGRPLTPRWCPCAGLGSCLANPRAWGCRSPARARSRVRACCGARACFRLEQQLRKAGGSAECRASRVLASRNPAGRCRAGAAAGSQANPPHRRIPRASARGCPAHGCPKHGCPSRAGAHRGRGVRPSFSCRAFTRRGAARYTRGAKQGTAARCWT